MLKGACMVLGNRYPYTIFIENGLIYSKWGWGHKAVSLSMGCLEEIIEKHWTREW